MMRVALSGGIASGKTMVSNIIAGYGVPIIDTDVLAREVVVPGSIGLQRIVDRFGKSVLDEDNVLDRKKLRGIVFSDDDARRDLESILHPLIRELTNLKLDELEQQDTLYAVVVIPLLVETGQHKSYDHVVIVDVEPAIQIKRLMARDNCSQEQARKILDSQASRKERLAVADDLILNSSTKKAVELQVGKVHDHLTALAKRKKKKPNQKPD